MMELAKGRIELGKSDFGDLLHLIYLEDVDLMRCDKRIFNIMKHCDSIPNDRLVKSLNELPSRIDDLIKRRADS